MTRKFSSQEILAKLTEAQGKEEQTIPLYKKQIEAEMFWSGLPEDVTSEIVGALETLVKESEGHMVLLKKVRELLTPDYNK